MKNHIYWVKKSQQILKLLLQSDSLRINKEEKSVIEKETIMRQNEIIILPAGS